MPAKNEDLHGNVPDDSSVVLIIIDMINDLEFPGGDKLLKSALPVAENIRRLKDKLKQTGVAIIYANDNFGRWQADFDAQISHCLNDNVRGEPIVKLLQPDEDDYFILKPKQSAFFSTTLDTLLKYLKTKTLILTGLTGDVCVLFTALDAYQRDFHIFIPSDCTASIKTADNETMLRQMERIIKSDIRPSTELDINSLIQK